MADAVSKLYAEIGFKVNQDGLKQVQSILKDFAKQMNEINRATKETAKSFGIFSKEKAKQSISDEKQAREQLKTERERTKNKMVIRNQEFKEEMAIRKATFNEKLKQERENERLARSEQRRNEKQARERRKVLREALSATSNFVKGIASYATAGALGFSRLIYSGTKESLERSIATRDFMMMTGANLGDIQSVMGRFASIGESVDQRTIMGDLAKLSQNIASIALGQGNVSAYKLLGTSARRGDISGMIRGIGMAGQGMDPDLFAKLIGEAGLPSYWLSFFRAQGGGQEITNFVSQEGQQKIVEARQSLGTLSIAMKNLADWIAVTLSPTIREIASGIQDWAQEMSKSLQGEAGKKLSDSVRELANRFVDFIKRFDSEKAISLVTSFIGALEFLAGKVISIARALGYKTPEEIKEEQENKRLMDVWMSDMIMSGASLSDILRHQHEIPKARGLTVVDNRTINSNVTVRDEAVVEAVVEGTTGANSPTVLAAISGFGGTTSDY